MRSIRYHAYGDPAQVLRVDHVPAPCPPGPDEVLIRVLMRPVHPGDLLGAAGRYRAPGDRAPMAAGGAQPGIEGMGMVEETGTQVRAAGRLFPGMRVAFLSRAGAWSERVLVAADHVTALPEGVPSPVGAQLHVNPLVAQMLLRAAHTAGVGPQRAMVLSAAGSAVAKLLAALALRAGLPVIGLVRSRSGIAELARLHPDMPVIATDAADWQAALARQLDGKPLHAVFDAVGGALASALLPHLAPGGTLVLYGDMSAEPVQVPALLLVLRDLHVAGVSVGRWATLPVEQRREDLRGALDLALHYPHLFAVAGSYDLDDVATAVTHAQQPGKRGAVLLTSLHQGREGH